MTQEPPTKRQSCIRGGGDHLPKTIRPYYWGRGRIPEYPFIDLVTLPEGYELNRHFFGFWGCGRGKSPGESENMHICMCPFPGKKRHGPCKQKRKRNRAVFPYCFLLKFRMSRSADRRLAWGFFLSRVGNRGRSQGETIVSQTVSKWVLPKQGQRAIFLRVPFSQILL